MRTILAVGVGLGLIGGLVAGCSADKASTSVEQRGHVERGRAVADLHTFATGKLQTGRIAQLADRGSLVAYSRENPVRKGSYTWYPVQLSEEAALSAVKRGSLVINAPSGEPIRLRYERHVEHADGNWTWIGRAEGAAPGVEAVLTFGEKAVFGTIPNGLSPALQVTTAGGQTWMVEGNPQMLASAGEAAVDGDAADFLSPTPKEAAAQNRMLAQANAAHPMTSATAQAAAATTNAAAAAPVVDLLIGYTSGFASRLGGRSQALTRLNFLVDLGNEAFSNSHVSGRVRLVHALQVNYADATSNSAALFDLSGMRCTTASGLGQHHLPDRDVNCSAATPSAGLQPLLQAREQYRADLVALVRMYQQPANQSCGVAWLLGGGQEAIGGDSAALAFSVIGDSSGNQFPSSGSTCRNETLVHELGHNMGLAHDRTAAAGTDDTDGDSNLLDPEEFGRFEYSFGGSTDAAHGNYYTIMSQRQGNQSAYRVFSNPRITTCGGFACGVAGQSDNALTLEQTMPVIAGFRGAPYSVLLDSFTDINGDGRDDIFWSNHMVNSADWWLMNGVHWTYGHGKFVNGQYLVMGRGDFDGDGRSDILWADSTQLWIWHSEAAGGFTAQLVGKLPKDGWAVAGISDFNGDGRDDIFWTNRGRNSSDWWLMNGNRWTYGHGKSVSGTYRVAALGDFDGDGRSDVLWEDGKTLWIWHSEAAGGFTVQFLANYPTGGWSIVGANDINGDGRADLFWSNPAKQSADWWLMDGTRWTYGRGKSVLAKYHVAGLGDFDGDGRSDVLWEDGTSLYIWRSEAAGGFSIQFLAKQPVNWTPML
jgi:FG-GAP repeat.